MTKMSLMALTTQQLLGYGVRHTQACADFVLYQSRAEDHTAIL